MSVKQNVKKNYRNWFKKYIFLIVVKPVLENQNPRLVCARELKLLILFNGVFFILMLIVLN